MRGFQHHAIAALLAILTLFQSHAGELRVPGQFGTIQAAIDAAKPGDVVLIQPGVYREQLRLRSGVSLRSVGDDTSGGIGLARAESTVLDAGGKSPAVMMGQDSSIDGLTVTGAGSFDQAEFDRHRAERGENLPDERGIVGEGHSPAAIVIASADAQVRHCIVHDNGSAGIGASGAGFRTVVEGNHVFRNMGGGIAFADKAEGRVADNHCWQNLRAGIGCRGASPTVEGNRCYENVRAGIGIREGAEPLVRHNHCYRNRRAGIGVRMLGSEPIIRANHCYENGMAGIGCRDGAAPIIIGNECYRNRLAGVGAMSGARPEIVGNKIYGNEAAGIGLDACDSGEAIIRGNQIEAKSLVCIGIQSGWDVRIEGNEIRREGGMPPLVMVFEGAAAEFIGNHFVGSGVAAIRSAGQVFVCENEFDCPAPRVGGPPQQAVWALDGSMLSMGDDNQIRGWREPENPALRVADREGLRKALERAQPGTTILLAPGDYAGGLSIDDLHGSPGKPIVIAAAIRNEPPVFRGGGSGLHLRAPQHVELRHLVFSGAGGNGLNIDDAGNPDTPALHVKLSGLEVREIEGGGNRDGIKLSGVTGFRVVDCRIERWGSGGSGIDMVGCHDGMVVGSEFEHGVDATAANGVQAKGGSSRITIRRCHFTNAGGRGVNLGGSTGGDYFRPREAAAEASDLVVEDCLFEGSMAPIAFVGVSGALVRRNTILRPKRWVLRILQENTDARMQRCRDGRFERNLIAFRSDELHTAANVGPGTDPVSFRFAANEWICLDKPAESQRRIQLPVAESGGVYAAGLEGGEFDEGRLKQDFNAAAGVRSLVPGEPMPAGQRP